MALVPLSKEKHAVRVIARHLRDENCLAASLSLNCQDVSSGPLGTYGGSQCLVETPHMRECTIAEQVSQRKQLLQGFVRILEVH